MTWFVHDRQFLLRVTAMAPIGNPATVAGPLASDIWEASQAGGS